LSARGHLFAAFFLARYGPPCNEQISTGFLLRIAMRSINVAI
jgi:hypothetical protein